MILTNWKRWRYVNVDWFSCEYTHRHWRTRLQVSISFGWHCWGVGISTRIAPARDERHLSLGLGPLAVRLILLPVPVCGCCGGDPDAPSEDCAAHPAADEVTR